MINLTPHSVEVFAPEQFTNLEQVNPTTWVADSVEGEAIAVFPSQGVARISTSTVESGTLASHGLGFALETDDRIGSIPLVVTEYGDATGIPEDLAEGESIIVSLPMQSMAKTSGHHLATRMVAPYRVVRSRSNGSLVLGCMGFTY